MTVSKPHTYVAGGTILSAQANANFDALFTTLGLKDYDSQHNTDGTHKAITSPSIITTGNASFGGTLGVTGNTTLSGTLGVTGAATLSSTLSVEGNTTLGNLSTDTITFTGQAASHFLPTTDDTYDLGGASNEWRNLYIDGTANIDTLNGVAATDATTADTIGSAMTATGADAIADTMTATGADAIAATMTATGADAIAADISATGANAILADVSTFPATQANLAAASRTRTVSTDGTDPGAGGVVRTAEITYTEVDASGAFSSVTGASVTLTTSGRPVVIQCVSNATDTTPTTSESGFNEGNSTSGGKYNTIVAILRDGAIVSKISTGIEVSTETFELHFPVNLIQTIDFPAAGTYTWTLQAACEEATSVSIRKCYLVAYEL